MCDDDFSITTNSLENVNGRLKSKVGTGFLSRSNAYKKIKEFQLHYITQYTAKVVHNGLYSSDMEPADFGKVPDPDLNELQQSMSD